jgi:predicted DNA-binding protein
MSKDRFSYRVFAFRLTKEVKDKLNEARKKSGLSWNLFVRDLLHKTKDIDFSLAKEELEELEELEEIREARKNK